MNPGTAPRAVEQGKWSVMGMVTTATDPGRGGKYYIRIATLRSETMRQQEAQPEEEDRRLKIAARETDQAARDQVRRERYLAREQAIEEAGQAKAAHRAEKRDAEEIAQLAKNKARKETFFTKEQAKVEAQEAKKLKDKKQPPSLTE